MRERLPIPQEYTRHQICSYIQVHLLIVLMGHEGSIGQSSRIKIEMDEQHILVTVPFDLAPQLQSALTNKADTINKILGHAGYKRTRIGAQCSNLVIHGNKQSSIEAGVKRVRATLSSAAQLGIRIRF